MGTITEVYDYLRLLFARAGRPHCPQCGEPIARQTPQQIVDRLLGLPEGTRFQVIAPVIRGRKGEYHDLFTELATEGFARVRVDGEVHQLTAPPTLDKQKKHAIDVIIDRLAVKPSVKQRLTDSVETALRLAQGVVSIDFVDEPEGPNRERRYSEKLACPNEHDISVEELEPRQFSFNGPWGACPVCSGLGTTMEVDPELVVPDTTLSLSENAISVWSSPTVAGYFQNLLAGIAETEHFSLNTPFRDLTSAVQQLVMLGVSDPVYVRHKNRYGRVRTYTAKYEGAIPYIKRRHAEAETDTARERYAEFMREIPCAVCKGARLKPTTLAVTVGGKNIAEIASLSIDEAATFLGSLELSAREAQIAERVLKEIQERLRFLLDVGLDYLSLSRPAATLSGGEAQRIRLATQIGSGLVGVLYVLDEPSIGLHQRDNRRLIETLIRLRNLGNTLIVVEHDEDTIRTADWAVDIGPGAGEHGGEVIVSGPVSELLASKESITGAYLSGRRSIPLPAFRRPSTGRSVTIVEARENNLRDVTVEFPLGQLISVTGVSGSGKSTLVNGILYAALARRIYNSKHLPGRHTRIEGYHEIDKIIHVDQSPIGRTPRSNPATYTGSSTASGACSPRPRRRRSAATSPAASPSTSRAGAARTAPATARSRSR